jgi:hypothetical protein
MFNYFFQRLHGKNNRKLTAGRVANVQYIPEYKRNILGKIKTDKNDSRIFSHMKKIYHVNAN